MEGCVRAIARGERRGRGTRGAGLQGSRFSEEWVRVPGRTVCGVDRGTITGRDRFDAGGVMGEVGRGVRVGIIVGRAKELERVEIGIRSGGCEVFDLV